MGDHGYANDEGGQTNEFKRERYGQQGNDGFRFPEPSPFLGTILTMEAADSLQKEVEKRVCRARLQGVAACLDDLLTAGLAVNPQRIRIARLYPGEYHGNVEKNDVSSAYEPVEAFEKALNKAVASRGLEARFTVILEPKGESHGGLRPEEKAVWIVLVPMKANASGSR